MAKKIKNTDYLYITAYIRAKENSMMNRDRFERMISARTVKDAAKILEECGYGDMSDINQVKLNEKINEKRAAVMEDLASSVPDKDLLDIFRIKYDYHNAKVLIKSEAMGVDPQRLLSGAGRYGADELISAYHREDSALFSNEFREAIDSAKDTLARTGDPQLADFILDNAYFVEFIGLSQKTGSKFLEGYGRLMVDCANLKSAIRALRMNKDVKFIRRILSDGGNVAPNDIIEGLSVKKPFSEIFAGSPLKDAASLGDAVISGAGLTEFEKACDGVLNAYLTSAKYVSFGPEVLTAYNCNVEEELSAVRVIMTGKMTGLSSEAIRERVGSFEE